MLDEPSERVEKYHRPALISILAAERKALLPMRSRRGCALSGPIKSRKLRAINSQQAFVIIGPS